MATRGHLGGLSRTANDAVDLGVFKLEKGYIQPSLEVWLRISRDMGLSDRRAGLLWLKAKLPDELQRLVDVDRVADSDADGQQTHGLDYSKFPDRESMRTHAVRDDSVPAGLCELLQDGEIWTLIKPTGEEINLLRDFFGQIGDGTSDDYREALLLVRRFRSRTR